MSKTIQCVPDSISRADYIAMIERCGFDPNNIASLTFEANGIHAVVFERNADGMRFFADMTTGEGGYAKRDAFIPVRDEEPTND